MAIARNSQSLSPKLEFLVVDRFCCVGSDLVPLEQKIDNRHKLPGVLNVKNPGVTQQQPAMHRSKFLAY